jgi:hypothetical protein
MNWAIYVRHPFELKDIYMNILYCKTKNQAIKAAREVPDNWSCYICNFKTFKSYDRFGNERSL